MHDVTQSSVARTPSVDVSWLPELRREIRFAQQTGRRVCLLPTICASYTALRKLHSSDKTQSNYAHFSRSNFRGCGNPHSRLGKTQERDRASCIRDLDDVPAIPHPNFVDLTDQAVDDLAYHQRRQFIPQPRFDMLDSPVVPDQEDHDCHLGRINKNCR